VLDMLAEQARIAWDGGTNRFSAETGRGTILGQSCFLLKPMTFMNLSGRSVAKVMQFFKITAADMIVLHDDLDMPAGTVKAREGGGHGGHNGIRSIIAETGQTEFHRIKLGIGRPAHPGDAAVTNWVLGRMTVEELLALQQEMLTSVNIRLKGIFDKGAAKP
jgi:PTH1 family peptidyl-tRNA hydrolase